MNKKIIVIAMLLVLAACRDPGPAEADNAQTPAPQAEATQSEVAKPAVERKTEFVSPIAGGITSFPFQYHVSVDREVTRKKDGQKSREVGIEFLDSIVPDVEKAVTAEFAKEGYQQASREEQGRAIRVVYSKQGQGDVLVWVRPGAPRGERYVLQMPDAKGTVYMAYSLAN
ncbi:hypothetical protein [Pseudoxanthomonas putridarboris]|uniref:Lipoprotein n=1 Tax=Pseudoxanthomonas putridarboris TaxID=752605 RepID=A0ABU9IVR7_9GAMM